MTRAVDRLVARARRPPVPVARTVVGPTIVDIEPEHGVATAASPTPIRVAPEPAPPGEPTPQPAPVEPAQSTPRRVTTVERTAAVRPSRLEDTDEPAAPLATPAPADSGEIVVPTPEAARRPAARPPAIPHPPVQTPSATDGPAPGDRSEPPVVVATRDHVPSDADTPANPIARRLEAAAEQRVPTKRQPRPRDPEPATELRVVEPVVPAEPVVSVPVQAAPRPPTEPSAVRAARQPVPVAGTPPTVTIGTIEVVTAAPPAPAPRPLDSMAARRRSGRRWTGRAS